MMKLEILWEGKLLLDRIKWNNIIKTKNRFSHEYKTGAEKHWDDHIKKHPNDYDGTLIFLDKFLFKKNIILLDVSMIKFSIVTYLLKKEIPLKEGLGVLGTQYLVFSPNLDYVLVGQRALSQSYFPGAINVPGGILEINDLDNPPSIALMRELNEEVRIPLKSPPFLVAILGGWNNVSVTFLISTVISECYNFDPNQTISSDAYEWEGKLRWLSIKALQKMASENFLDGLIYYHLKLIKKNKSSIF